MGTSGYIFSGTLCRVSENVKEVPFSMDGIGSPFLSKWHGCLMIHSSPLILGQLSIEYLLCIN